MGCGYADEGEEVVGFALVAAVESAAAGEPGNGPLDGPAVAAEPLRGRHGGAGPGPVSAPLAETSGHLSPAPSRSLPVRCWTGREPPPPPTEGK